MYFEYQRPRKMEIEEVKPDFIRISAEPFERGYGTTMGIALRRVLMSLIEGSAVTAIRINGVLHEFSIIPGIYEDVLNIILNIKSIPFKLNVKEERIVRMSKTGPGKATSADIICDNDVEVLDKGVHVAFLEEGAKLDIEIVLKNGVGFKLADQNYDENLPVDFISLDANFNPLRKVSYKVLPARVGKKTDYDKLVFEVQTNGSVPPMETIARAAQILRDHLAIFLDFQDRQQLVVSSEQEFLEIDEDQVEFLGRKIEVLGLSIRALKCLKKLDVNYVYQLVEKTEEELLDSKNFGKKSLEEVMIKINDFNLVLGKKLPPEIRDKIEGEEVVAVEEEVAVETED